MTERLLRVCPAFDAGSLAWQVLAILPVPPSCVDADRVLAQQVAGLKSFTARWRYGRGPMVRRWYFVDAGAAALRWGTREVATVGAMGSWLGLQPDDLDWMVDRKGLERVAGPPLQNYRYRWTSKSSGGSRLVEAPKPRLKEAQRRLLHDVLDHLPPHEAVHGFRPGRSPLTFATPHVGQAVVVRVDLEDFFASVGPGRVRGVFEAAGYGREVASRMAALALNRSPRSVLAAQPAGGESEARWRQRRRLAGWHLPSGAPSSPALANVCAFGLDVRLAAAAGSVGATYTRYADDLAFSGDEAFRRRARRFVSLVMQVVAEEGFRVHPRKTRILPQSTRQLLAGVVVNERPAMPRDRYDVLRAQIHNCQVLGPSTQNHDAHADFRAHLQGVVAAARAIDAARGGRLAAMLERVDWSR